MTRRSAPLTLRFLLLLNRRGYSSFVFCPACKHSLQCRNCDVTLTFHKRNQRVVCHYCAFASHPYRPVCLADQAVW